MRLFYLSLMLFLASPLNLTAKADSLFDGEVFSYYGKLPATYESQEKISLEISFYQTATGNDVVSRVPRIYKDLPLSAGEFTAPVEMDRLEFESVFSGSGRTAFIQIKDTAKNIIFRRLPFTPVVSGVSADVPAKNDSSRENRISGSIGHAGVVQAACLAVNTAGAKFIVKLSDVKVTCQSACIHAESRSSCARGWTMFSSETFFEFGDECSKAATGFETPVEARYCCCLTTYRPMPIQLQSAHH